MPILHMSLLPTYSIDSRFKCNGVDLDVEDMVGEAIANVGLRTSRLFILFPHPS
jgi:hypothetical protein